MSRCTQKFPCPGCGVPLLSRNFPKHAQSCLNLDAYTQCIWCLGKVSWTRRYKGQYADHLMNCWDQCLFRQPPEPALPPEPVYHYTPIEPQLDDDAADCYRVVLGDIPSLHHLLPPPVLLDDDVLFCPERDFFGQSRIPGLPDLAYQPFSIFDHTPYQVFLMLNENLNLAASCTRAFDRLLETHDFYHCMVRAVVLPQFIEAMQADEGRTTLFPFSCWCIGTHTGQAHYDPKHRHHRHFIVVSPKGHFDEVWKKVKINPEDLPIDPETGLPEKHFRYKHKIPIVDRMHFVNLLGYVSKQISQCNGTFDEKEKKIVKSSKNHYFIMKSLPQNFRLPLVMQWEGGIMDLLTWENALMKSKELIKVPLQRVDGKWKVFVKDVPKIKFSRVISVAKHFKPVTNKPNAPMVTTDHYLWLNKGMKLYFERDEAMADLFSRDPVAWTTVQAEGGNLFYDAVAFELWTPTRAHQDSLDASQAIIYKVKSLEEQLKTLKESHKVEVATLREEVVELKEALVRQD